MLEIRALQGALSVSDDELPKIIGYAARYNSESVDMGFTEIIAPGAFDGAIGDDLVALVNHDDNYVLGRLAAGTLDVEVRSDGLWMEIQPPPTTWARDLIESIRRGDITGASFAFRVVSDRWTPDGSTRIIEQVDMRGGDVSVVTRPAYPATAVGIEEQRRIATRNRPVLQSSEVALAKRQRARRRADIMAAKAKHIGD